MSDDVRDSRQPRLPKNTDTRRQVLKVALGASLGAPVWTQLAAAKPENKMRPQPGDLVVHRFGDRMGQPIIVDEIAVGDELTQAVTMTPDTKVIRDGSRLNGLNVVRLAPSDLDDKTQPFAADGIVAYSSVCTHQGCDLTLWIAETRTFKCYCHYSEFDASQLGQPNHGPATRKLAILPLTVTENKALAVADHFKGKVGFKKS